jgi:tRNA A37 threonylcarbamoyladenosine synthetase subunit TsaC/SUA5/YrdC
MAKHITIDLLGQQRRVPVEVLHRVHAGQASIYLTDTFDTIGKATRRWRPRKQLPEAKVRDRQQKLHAFAEELRAARLHKLQLQDQAILKALQEA